MRARLAATLLLLLPLAPACDDPYEEAREGLRALPLADRPWDAALERADEAGRLREHCELLRELAASAPTRWQPAWAAGECLLRIDEPDAAAASFRTALREARRARDPVGIAQAGDEIGWLAYVEGRFDDSREVYLEALTAAGAAGRPELEAFTRSNYAGLLLDMGDLAGSRDQLERAEAFFEQAGMDDALLSCGYNRAIVSWELGNVVEAEEALAQVRDTAARVGDGWVVDAAAVTLGNLRMAMDDASGAARWFGEVGGQHADQRVLGAIGRGRAALRLGRPDDAAAALRGALDDAGGEDDLVELLARTFLAEAGWRAGRPVGDELVRIVAISDEREFAETAWNARALLGKIALAEGRTEDARRVLGEAVRRLDAMGGGLDPGGDGMYLLRERSDPYADLAAAWVDEPQRVLDVAARSQARALRHALAPARDGELARLRRGLARDERLLQFVIGEDRGVLLVVGRGGATARVVAGRREMLDTLRRFRDGLRTGGGGLDETTVAAGRRLREYWFDPVAAELAGARRLLVVPDRELALLPFAALPAAGGGFLVDRYEFAFLPLAGSVRAVNGSGPLLLAGNPARAPDSRFEELPWAAFELSKLLELHQGRTATYLEGAALDVDGLERAARGRGGTIHLATHAVASTRDPRRCGVVVSNDRRLGIDRILELELADPLVVLSACRTAEGELLPGEGVVGLTWAFVRAGAAAVVASQWSVDDEASARLMIDFHRRLAHGDDVVAALAGASRAAAARDADPARWAPFVAVLRPVDAR